MLTHRRREDGAVAPLFAIMLVMFFVAGALAVDLGGAWETKRDLITDLDSAALAGAAAASLDPSDCTEVRDRAEDILLENNPDADLSDFTVDCPQTIAGRAGFVHVRGSQESLVSLGRVARDGDIEVGGAAAARYGPVRVTEGVRPFTVCIEDPDIKNLLADPDAYFAQSHPRGWAKFPVDKATATDDCGDTPGRTWGWTCFADANCPQNNINEYLENGYPYGIDIGNSTGAPADCDVDTPDPDDCLAGGGSLGNSVGSILAGQICDAAIESEACEHQWTIVLHDDLVKVTGKGYYNPVAFLSLVVRDYKVTGPESDRYIEVEFTKLTLAGQIDPDSASIDMATQLCYGDSDPDGPEVTCDF